MKEGIPVQPVIVGICGTDHELMMMGKRGELLPEFPEGQQRLINGHEGVVWIPSQQRFAIVLICGGDSIDPTRYTEDETYFEYGCDRADGLFCDTMYVNPDILLPIPDEHVHGGKLDLSFAKKWSFRIRFSECFFSWNAWKTWVPLIFLYSGNLPCTNQLWLIIIRCNKITRRQNYLYNYKIYSNGRKMMKQAPPNDSGKSARQIGICYRRKANRH